MFSCFDCTAWIFFILARTFKILRGRLSIENYQFSPFSLSVILDKYASICYCYFSFYMTFQRFGRLCGQQIEVIPYSLILKEAIPLIMFIDKISYLTRSTTLLKFQTLP